MCCTTPASWLYASSIRKLLSAMGDCAAAGPPEGRTASTNTTRLTLLNLRANMFFVALRAVAVTELRFGSRFDIALDRLPLRRCIANPLAVGAYRQQPFELLHVGAQSEDPLRGFEPRAQLVDVDRFRDEVVGARVHPFEIALL